MIKLKQIRFINSEKETRHRKILRFRLHIVRRKPKFKLFIKETIMYCYSERVHIICIFPGCLTNKLTLCVTHGL